eukprot:TRINITY_DN6682_c0_g1_i14.p1 TRINITY_DN6682_c0_g1~~TRINITY_DN6682_c0_g1_i14.p1  ORF type:complete len:148 (+),score=8.00 TRINITY_DN6682_c0_g1_i14:83-526(+)
MYTLWCASRIVVRPKCTIIAPTSSRTDRRNFCSPKVPASEAFGSGSTTCWFCQQLTAPSDFFCSNCKSVQQLCYQCNYFQYFGLQPEYELNLEDLQHSYYSLQRKLHPDRFQRKSEIEKAFSQEQSASLNGAYKVLSSYLLRAQYIV